METRRRWNDSKPKTVSDGAKDAEKRGSRKKYPTLSGTEKHREVKKKALFVIASRNPAMGSKHKSRPRKEQSKK